MQGLINKNQRVRKTKRNYPFSGLLVCARCNKRLAGTTTKNRNGTPYRHYVCYNHKINKLCTNNLYLGEKKVEKYLLDNIKAHIEKEVYNFEVKSKETHIVDNSREIKRKLDRLKELYINEKINMEEYEKDYDRIKSELIVIDDTDHVNIQELKSFLNSGFENIYNDLDDGQKQTLWRSIIDTIIVDGHEIKDISFI